MQDSTPAICLGPNDVSRAHKIMNDGREKVLVGAGRLSLNPGSYQYDIYLFYLKFLLAFSRDSAK